MSARVVAAVAAWVFSLYFAALATRLHLQAGGYSRPKTFMSKSGHSAAEAEAVLLLLRQASDTLPRGARVVLIKPNQRDYDAMMMSLAHGQLPRQQVVAATTLSGDAPPDFVITFRGPLADERYERVVSSGPDGIWRRR